ncbi:MAG: efflux RND transporter periplasmic adaptor subunit [Bacteroidales bacterium]|nr:efflux RND transporter periplasmic adaptor subunit [Bacteroidales bacterium]HNW73502.1 efflux RND transporter periplasmic adaptor subunit [Bacteroidales bacterium]HPS49757.1 efflux RND transporter periplasmic adaptor subunit [Bacteroidales bacterium]
MKKIIKISVLVLILALFAATIIYLYNKSKEKPVVFQTETPFKTNIIKKTVATGSVIPRKEIEIKPQVSGIVEEIYVEAGEKVHSGDVIAKVRIIPDLVNLNNAEGRLERAKIAYDDAKLNFDRQDKLFKQGVIAETEFQQSQVTFKNARQEMDAAEANLELIREGVNKRSGKATNTLIRSTINGMILDIPIKAGSSVIETNNFNAGTTIASVADIGDMIFQGKVDETEVGKIKPGMPLLLTVGAIENDTFMATLKYIAPKGVLENGAVQFEIKADVLLKNDQFVRAGYSANADIVLQRADSVMAIKESLLQFDKDSAFVEVETGPQTFEKRFIKTGLSDGLNIQVLSGLTLKDKIKIPQNTAIK